MAMFWLWGVRNLFVALAGLVCLAGYRGVADWSITLVVMLGFAFIAEIGNRIGRRALAKKRPRPLPLWRCAPQPTCATACVRKNAAPPEPGPP